MAGQQEMQTVPGGGSWENVAENTAARWLLTTVVTGVLAGSANWFRKMAADRKAQSQVAQTVAEIKEVVAPTNSEESDLRTLLHGQQQQIDRINTRIDQIQAQGVEHYTKLCDLIVSSARKQ